MAYPVREDDVPTCDRTLYVHCGHMCAATETLAGVQKQQSARRPSRLWKGRSDRSRGEKLWPLTATQPSFRLKPSRSIGSGAGSSAT